MKKKLTFMISLWLTITWPFLVYSQDGSLDLTFGNNGIVITGINSWAQGNSIALQNDGKIVVAGYTLGIDQNHTCSISDWDFVLRRYNNDGSLDNTFAPQTAFFGSLNSMDNNYSADHAFAVAIQGDGKIIAAGRTTKCNNFILEEGQFALVRYNINGTLDQTFGPDGNGKVNTDFSGGVWGYSVVIQNDGKILVAGLNSGNFAIARYNIDGTLDGSFDGDGRVVTDFGGDDVIKSIALQSDNRILVAGYTNVSNKYEFALARYNFNGSLDNTFDGDGKVITGIGNIEDACHSLLIQNDGKILVTGYSIESNGSIDIALARYNSNGTLDNSFDGDGKVTKYIGASIVDDVGTCSAIQSDGKIVVGGNVSGDFALIRLNYNGSLDPGFNSTGIVTTDCGLNDDVVRSMSIQSDGKMVVAGYADTFFALARYNSTNGNDIKENYSPGHIITISPNPLISSSVLQFNDHLSNAEVIIYDLLGEEKCHTKFTGDSMEIKRGNLISGVYFVKVYAEEKLWTGKIVVE